MPQSKYWNLAGQFVVIVASILLAFAIQAWWDDRSEIVLEQRILNALLSEFEENGELLREAREHFEQRYTEAVRILEYLDGNHAEIDEAEFEKLVGGLLSARSFHLELGAHTGLIASGELSLISDERLRSRLAAWPSYVAEWTEEAEAFILAGKNLIPLLSDWVQLRNVSPAFAPFPDGKPLPPIPIGSVATVSLSSLRSSVEFENVVYESAQGTWYAVRDGETLRAQLAVILDLIRENLDE